MKSVMGGNYHFVNFALACFENNVNPAVHKKNYGGNTCRNTIDMVSWYENTYALQKKKKNWVSVDRLLLS